MPSSATTPGPGILVDPGAWPYFQEETLTDQPVVWAGVVLRFADGTWASYEFDQEPHVQLRVSTGDMSREQLLTTLLSGNVAEEVDVRVAGKSKPWIGGVRTARIGQLEEAAREQVLADRPLVNPPPPPVA